MNITENSRKGNPSGGAEENDAVAVLDPPRKRKKRTFQELCDLAEATPPVKEDDPAYKSPFRGAPQAGHLVINEADDDPHRLAAVVLVSCFTSPAGEVRLVTWRDEFYVHDGRAFRRISQAEVEAEVTKAVKNEFDRVHKLELSRSQLREGETPTVKKVTTALIRNVMLVLRSRTLVPGQLELPCWIGANTEPFPAANALATRSGILNVPSVIAGTPEVIPSTPRFFSQNSVAYEFDPNATCPQFLQFLDSLWPGDPESIECLQEWLGYLLLPDTRQHKMLMLIGPPRSGKGTIGRLIQALVGAGALASPTLNSLTGPFGLWPLLGKSVALIADARLSGRADAIAVVERLLSISGEDPQDVHRKSLPTITGVRLPVRFVLLTNELPNLRDSSGALTTRVILLRITRSFLGREDKSLTSRLLTELPGILNWAIEGWHRLQKRGAFEQPASARELLDDLEDLASPISQFTREACIVGPEFSVAVDDIFAAWKGWCEKHGRDHPGTREGFGKDLRAAVPQVVVTQPRRSDGGRVRVYQGIGIRDSGTGWNASQSFARVTENEEELF